MDTHYSSREARRTAIDLPMSRLSKPPVEDDDDVQFMFSAPKRKFRKRKGFSGGQPMNPNNLRALPLLRPIMAEPVITRKMGHRRASTGMIQPLKSCHIGHHESTRLRVRSGSLPAIPAMAGRSPPTQFDPSMQSSYWHPVYGSVVPDHTLTLVSDAPSILSQPYISPNDWKSLQSAHNSAKKQKRFHSTNHSEHPYQSSQISPRTSPASLPISVPHPSGDHDTGFLDMLGSSATQDMQYVTIPSDPMEVTWDDVSYEAPPNIDPRMNQFYFGSENTPFYPIGMEAMTPNRQMAPPYFLSNRTVNIASYPNPSNPMEFQQYQVANTHPGMLDYRSANEQTPSSLEYANLERHRHGRENHYVLQTAATTPGMNLHSISRVAPGNSSTPHPRYFWQTPRPPQLISTRNPEPISPDTPQTQEANMQRRPSLYSVPPWLPSTSTVTSKQPADTTRRGILTQNPSSGHDGMGDREMVTSQRGAIPEISNQSGQSNGEINRQRHEVIPATTTGQSENTRPQNSLKKHSPNLIVDIAETCRETCPFDLIAERHKKPIQKVYDAFAAIIQIPLLRNADDKRRPGPLAKKRMQEFRDARKAMALAKEEEEKAKARREMQSTGADSQFGGGRRAGKK